LTVSFSRVIIPHTTIYASEGTPYPERWRERPFETSATGQRYALQMVPTPAGGIWKMRGQNRVCALSCRSEGAILVKEQTQNQEVL